MSEPEFKQMDQIPAFVRIWTESLASLAQAAFTYRPDATPPDVLRQMRSGIFQALARSWDEYLRSPEFMESSKQLMDQAIAVRKLSADFLTKARHELGEPSLQDVDGIIAAVRQSEARLTGRLQALSDQISGLEQRIQALERAQAVKSASEMTAERPRRSTERARRDEKH